MQTRNSFNGGEWSPEMGVRADLETYPRGNRCMENWELSPEGGIRNRKGFGKLAFLANVVGSAAPGAESFRLFGYVYTQSGAGGRYAVVVYRLAGTYKTEVLVYRPDGTLEARLNGGEAAEGEEWRAWLPELADMRARQVNALLYLMAPNERPWVLKRDSAGVWTLEAWKFKSVPWRHTPGEDRDDGLVLRMGRSGSDEERDGAWYTASDSGRQGGAGFTHKTTERFPFPQYGIVVEQKDSGQMRGELYYNALRPAPEQSLSVNILWETRTLYANSYAKAEMASALAGAGISAPNAQGIQTLGLCKSSNLQHTGYPGFSLHPSLPVGSSVTLYVICAGNPLIFGLDDLEALWAEETGVGFTRNTCPSTASGKLHLLRIRGKMASNTVYIENMTSFLWCGAIAENSASSRTYELDFSHVAEEGELPPETARADEDYLRASYWTEPGEAVSRMAELLDGVYVQLVAHDKAYTADANLPAGRKVAFLEHDAADCPEEIYSCIADYNCANLYVNGLDSPANYTGNFVKSTRQSIPSGATPIRLYSLKEASGTINKGKYVALVMQNWRYYTVRKPINAGQSFPHGPANCPDYFAPGLICGEPLPCRGAWSTYTSGVWYGEYAVKRNYDTVEPLGEGWETAGRTVSRIGSPTNKLISGDESGEECNLALWLLGSRCMDADMTDLSAGFPGDSCENRLIVESYRRDLVFKLVAQEDGTTTWAPEGGKLPEWEGDKQITDWSWWAYSPRYGGPTSCDVYAQRLVFAGTHGQPQTLWASKTDDFDNFAVGSDDADALELTLATTSQNPICWIQAKGDILLLGTGEAEYSVSSRAGGAFTAATAVARPQSYIGSANAPCIQADNRVLFLQRGGRRLYEIGYDFETDGYVSRDLTLLASHLGREHGGFKRGALAKVPYTTAYLVMGDGTLCLLAYNPLENIKGWHRWNLPNSVSHPSRAIDICVLPSSTGDDEVYLLKTCKTGSQWEVVLTKYGLGFSGDHYFAANSQSVVAKLTTLPFSNSLATPADKRNSGTLKICLGADFYPNDEYTFIMGRGSDLGHEPDRDMMRPLKKGWNDLVAPGGWQFDDSISITTVGLSNSELHILALQG